MYITVKMKSFDLLLLQNYLNSLIKTKRIVSIVRFPKKHRRITILASPHVNIKAREQYEFTIHNVYVKMLKKDFIIPPSGIGYRIFFNKSC